MLSPKRDELACNRQLVNIFAHFLGPPLGAVIAVLSVEARYAETQKFSAPGMD